MRALSKRFVFPLALVFALVAGSWAEEKAKPAPRVKKKVALDKKKNLFLEIDGDKRRVWLASKVCFREGALELLLTLKEKKEHEAILAADIDAKALHAALLAAGAKQGTPVKFEPKFVPAKGQRIDITLQYDEKGKPRQVRAQEWVRDTRTNKSMAHHWVFAGSQFVKNPFEENGKPLYAARDGDIVSVSNFDTSILDLPIPSSKANEELLFTAFTKKIPPMDTKVWVIFEPVR